VASARQFNTEKAITLLRDITSLLTVATPVQQRALIRQVLKSVWIEKVAVTAIKPTATFALLVELVAQGSLAISTGLEPATFSSGG